MKMTLEKAFPIVAAALGRKLGVRVEVHGDRARTNGTVIQIPSLKMESSDHREVAWGFLAHESAHLRWTDFDVFRAGATSPLRQSLLNIIEDIRIERRLVDLYPGTRLSLERTVEAVLSEGGFALQNPNAPLGAHLQAYVLLMLRARDLGQKALGKLADEAGQRLHRHLGYRGMNRLHSILGLIEDLEDTQEALALVDRLLEIQPEDPDPERNPDRSEQEFPGGQNPQGGDVDQDPDGDMGHASNGPGRCESVMESDLIPDPFAKAAMILEREAMKGVGATLPVADDVPPSGAQSLALLATARMESKGLRSSLEGLVQAQVERRVRHQRQGLRLDGARLPRLSVGDPRIFLARGKVRHPDTAVHLLIDRSPSMSALVSRAEGGHARRIDLAFEAAIALTLALEAIPGVNPGVTAFPGEQGEATRVFRVLPHGVRLSSVQDRLVTDLDGSTPLAEALLYGASELLATRESRKVLLVLTDGIPDDLDAAITMVREIREAGIEVHGIGLAIEVDRVFGPSVTISDLGELRKGLFNLCQGILAYQP